MSFEPRRPRACSPPPVYENPPEYTAAVDLSSSPPMAPLRLPSPSLSEMEEQAFITIFPAPILSTLYFPRDHVGLGLDHPMYHASGALPSPDDDSPSPSPVDDSSSTVHAVLLPPRDFSALCSLSAYPWRAIRRRNLRLLPPHCERRPFPQSLPKKTTIAISTIPTPASPPPPSAPIHALSTPVRREVPAPPLPPPREPQSGLSLRPADLLDLLPLLHPIGPDDPFYPDEVPSIDMPAPSLCPCPADHLPRPIPPIPAPSLPADTSYGVVQSSLALACTTAVEKHFSAALADVVSVAWGPYGTYEEKGLLAQLPGDQLVFLCMLPEFVRLEPVFAEFLDPAIINFARGWVNHCRREDGEG
ncbi:hypothetical protein B0H13DRAFT_2335354 [Mycena leptocephala]|nr:hypothetical protein B0H13DRAFT_2335354 [Mycena leptocephala]